MYRLNFVCSWLSALFVSGCLNAPAPPEERAARVSISPAQDDAAGVVERVVRIRLLGSDLALEDLRLYSGELSDSAQRSLRQREIQQSLPARESPCLCWIEADSHDRVCAPSSVLTPGARYSFAAVGYGLLAAFDVAEQGASLLGRYFPGASETGAGFWVLCGNDAPNSGLSLSLAPSGTSAWLEPDLGLNATGEPCSSVLASAPPASGELSLLPPEAAGILLDPAPAWGDETPVNALATCADNETALGPGCLQVEDDRVLIRNGSAGILWQFDSDGAARVQRTDAGASFLVRGFTPASEQGLSGAAYDRFGVRTPIDVTFHTSAPRAHWLLNEVMANPLGPEPAQEWIELVNDSSLSAELGGLRLEDSAGSITLPAFSARPGQYLLLVRDDYDPEGDGRDVMPAAGAALVRVPVLGRSGLSNSGETLTLRAPDGRVLSRFPAFSSGRAGVSVARATLDALDEDASAFGAHAAPGASPGAPNQVQR